MSGSHPGEMLRQTIESKVIASANLTSRGRLSGLGLTGEKFRAIVPRLVIVSELIFSDIFDRNDNRIFHNSRLFRIIKFETFSPLEIHPSPSKTRRLKRCAKGLSDILRHFDRNSNRISHNSRLFRIIKFET